MCYVSWAALRINIRISGKNSKDTFKEGQAKAVKSVCIMLNLVTLIIPAIKIINNTIFSKWLFVTTGIIVFCLYFWIDSYEDVYYRMFEKMSKNERIKMDLYALLYFMLTWLLLAIVAFSFD